MDGGVSVNNFRFLPHIVFHLSLEPVFWLVGWLVGYLDEWLAHPTQIPVGVISHQTNQLATKPQRFRFGFERFRILHGL